MGWTLEEVEGYGLAAEEVRFDVVACFDHVTSSPRRAAAWDTPAPLCTMAAPTRDILLAVRLLNVLLAAPIPARAQPAVAQATSGGRHPAQNLGRTHHETQARNNAADDRARP